METVFIVIHLMIVLALVAIILLQRSEGGALGIGGGSGGLMSARGVANTLTRITTFLAICFFATSIVLGVFARMGDSSSGILDIVPSETKNKGEGGILDQLRQEAGALSVQPDDNNKNDENPQVPVSQ